MNVDRIISHSNYSGTTFNYDITLVVLTTNINIDGVTTKVIPLPVQDAVVADNVDATLTGWGSTKEGGEAVSSLRKVIVPIVNQEICSNAFDRAVTSRMICAGDIVNVGKDTCTGDAGSPLVIDGILIGIASWGRGCERPEYPGVYVRVPALRNWIDSSIP